MGLILSRKNLNDPSIWQHFLIESDTEFIILGLSLLIIDGGIRDFISFCRKEFDKRRLTKKKKSLSNPLLPKFIDSYYRDYEILIECSKEYPVVICKFDEPITDFYSFLGNLNEQQILEDNLLINDNGFLNYQKRLKKLTSIDLFNKNNFSFQYFDKQNKCIHTRMGSYYNSIKSCESLEDEILTKFCNIRSVNKFYKFQKKLKNRNLYHLTNDDPFHSGKFRSATIGISTTVVFRKEDKYYSILALRSEKNATYSGMMHV